MIKITKERIVSCETIHNLKTPSTQVIYFKGYGIIANDSPSICGRIIGEYWKLANTKNQYN